MRRRLSNEEFMQWAIYYGKKAQAQELEMLKARR